MAAKNLEAEVLDRMKYWKDIMVQIDDKSDFTMCLQAFQAVCGDMWEMYDLFSLTSRAKEKESNAQKPRIYLKSEEQKPEDQLEILNMLSERIEKDQSFFHQMLLRKKKKEATKDEV